MTVGINKKINAMKCPVCGKSKFIAVENASGKTAEVCHVCKRYLLLDWDKMEAKETKPIKDAYKMVVNN